MQEFLLRFDLGPPEGFHDGPQPLEEVTATTGAPGQSTAEVPLGREPYEGVEWGGVGQGNVVNEILVRSWFSEKKAICDLVSGMHVQG